VAFDVLLFTGLRRGDAVRLGRPHVKDGVANIRTEKTGQLVIIPILPPLQASLDAGPIGELTFIAGERGRPMKKESFGTWFRNACRAAGVHGSAHGLRKAGATRAANNGATEAQLEAIFGWRGGGMASLYTRQANRAKLARDAAITLLQERDANIYSRTLARGAGIGQNKPDKSVS
jgi:integrase